MRPASRTTAFYNGLTFGFKYRYIKFRQRAERQVVKRDTTMPYFRLLTTLHYLHPGLPT